MLFLPYYFDNRTMYFVYSSQSLGIKASSHVQCSLIIKIQQIDLQMLRFVFVLVMAFTILVADVGSHPSRNRQQFRYNLLKKYHKSRKATHFGSEPNKRFLRQKMNNMLYQRRNVDNKLFNSYYLSNVNAKYDLHVGPPRRYNKSSFQNMFFNLYV